MDNSKKISITYYPNKRAKSITQKGVEMWPLYARIVFNRESLQVKALNKKGEAIYVPAQSDQPHEVLLDVFVQDVVSKIIRFEYNKLGDRFSFKGFGNRLMERYLSNIEDVVFKSLDTTINKSLGDVLTHNQYMAMVKGNDTIFDKLEYLSDSRPATFVDVVEAQSTDYLITYFLFREYLEYLRSMAKRNHLDETTEIYEWICYGHIEGFQIFLETWDVKTAKTFFFHWNPHLFDSQRVIVYASILNDAIENYAIGLD